MDIQARIMNVFKEHEVKKFGTILSIANARRYPKEISDTAFDLLSLMAEYLDSRYGDGTAERALEEYVENVERIRKQEGCRCHAPEH